MDNSNLNKGTSVLKPGIITIIVVFYNININMTKQNKTKQNKTNLN